MDYEINDGAYQRLMSELNGERLLWSGRPAQGLRLRRADRVMIPLSVFWLGFAGFFEYMAIHNDGDEGVIWPLVIGGGVFILIGFYLLIGRFFHDAARRKSMVYGITDSRAIIVSAGGKRVRAVKLSAVPEITLRENPDGSGDVLLGTAITVAGGFYDSVNMTTLGDSRVQPPTLELVANAREVYDLCLRVQAGNK